MKIAINVYRYLSSTIFLLFLLILCGSSIQASNHHKIFLQATQGVPGLGAVTFKDGKLLVCGNYSRSIKAFDPALATFEEDVFVLPANHFSFPMDCTPIPADPSRGIVGGFACTSFFDGRIWSVLNDGSIIQSNQGIFKTAQQTGPVNIFTYNPELRFVWPIAYRKSNDRLYTQGFNNKIYRLDWRGSPPFVIPLSEKLSLLKSFQFGPDDQLYCAHPSDAQIVKIDVDTGLVTPIVDEISSVCALKIDKNGVLYFASRTEGKVYTYDVNTSALTVLTTLDPPLAGLAFNADETKLYVTNERNKIFEVDIGSGVYGILFESPMIRAGDLALDGDSLYFVDSGNLKQFSTQTGELKRQLASDFSCVCGIQVEPGENGKIVISDSLLGDVTVFNKSDLSLHDVFNYEETHLFGKQSFSAVRVVDEAGKDYYLATNSVEGKIIKFTLEGITVKSETFFSGLQTPLKLKVHKGFVYVVEAGDVLLEIPNTGSVSRIPLIDHPALDDKQVLLSNLNQPQGFDIFEDKILVVEAANRRILQASALTSSQPKVIQEDLQLENADLIYPYAPINIIPFVGLAVSVDGKQIYVYQSKPNNILLIERGNE